jgi:hypothetical protein
VRDLNGNGTIDNQSELFGSASQSGFAVLSTLDQNSDGVINSSDQGFASLSVWQDLNRNGITDQGELKSLSTAGISAITLNPTIPTLTTAAGNTIIGQSTVTFSNGQIRNIFDVVLKGNQSDTKYLGDSTVSTAALAVGSNLKGYGNVKNLDIAMTGDATLLFVHKHLKSQFESRL